MHSHSTQKSHKANKHHKTQVCIVGAGPVGTSLACSLSQIGCDVAIIDKSSLKAMEEPSLDGRAYAIAAAPKHDLEHYGIWQHLPTPPSPIEDILVMDGKANQAPSQHFLKFDRQDASQPFGWMTRALSLRIALNKALLEAQNVTIFAPASADVSCDTKEAHITLSTGETLTAQLVIAADGRNSFLRRKAHIAVTKIPYHQTAMVGVMAHEVPHNNCALEHFLPHGPFAQLPLQGTTEHPNMSAFVWSEKPENAQRFLGMSDKLFSRQLQARLIGRDLGEVKVINPKWSYPLSAQYAQRYISTRLALIGDSAHGVHPIAGQGLNLGFRDIHVLTDLIAQACERGEDLGAPTLLQRYQQLCRPNNLFMLAATDCLDKIFSNNNPILRPLRDLGLSTMARMPKLRKTFVKYAMGM